MTRKNEDRPVKYENEWIRAWIYGRYRSRVGMLYEGTKTPSVEEASDAWEKFIADVAEFKRITLQDAKKMLTEMRKKGEFKRRKP